MKLPVWNILFRWMLITGLLGAAFTPVLAQTSDPAAVLLRAMTPEEKVGQLFLVSFTGTTTTATSQIYDLIANRHVGGVVLTAANDNFASDQTPTAARDLIAALQKIEADSALKTPQGAQTVNYVPLFIGISQEGGGAPNDQILTGLTPLPDQMALGAAWDRSLSQRVGEVMGRELAAMGFNLYFGLSLDVLTLTDPAMNSDLNTRAFGGDPYWVGQMSSAYLTGLHNGAAGRLAVIAKHFPGLGGSDRPVNQEISTVRRSLDELKSIELAPFFAVTGDAPDAASTTDGLLVSHIRYQGFQGNIRATTRPISFDQQALSQVLGLPQLAAWRKNGGLLVSDDLDTLAVRRFYDPDLRNFSARLVARDAFLAGNDLIYMGNIISSDAEDTYTSVTRALDFFVQKYREDPAFASRVDESAHNILALKFRLYGSFNQPVQPPSLAEANLGGGKEEVFAVAREAATLINPSQKDLTSVLPTPPGALDYIVFLSDSRTARQCSSCPDFPILGSTSFQLAVQRLYGPQGGGLVIPSHLSSFTFDDVNLLLDGTSPTPDLENSLNRASWIVISTLDMPAGSAQIATLKRFLSEKQSLLTAKKTLLFSFNAPYYFDATTISKFVAYYGLYSESEPFIEVAARLLFQEISPAGALPVSVPSVGYDLITATSPDPVQVIKLNLNFPSTATPAPGPQPATPLEPSPTPSFRAGDTISLTTGVILDHNQRPVPDGAIVRFSFTQGESGLLQQMDIPTTQGVAVANYRLEKAGLIEIKASSEPARVSDTIQLNVTSEGAQVLIITPTIDVTPAPTATATPVLPVPTPASPVGIENGYPNLVGWFLVLVVLLAGAGLTFWLGEQIVEPKWALRWALLVFLAGLITYNYLILGFPGGDEWLAGRGLPGFFQAVLIGQVIGFAAGWFWRLMAESGNQAQE